MSTIINIHYLPIKSESGLTPNDYNLHTLNSQYSDSAGLYKTIWSVIGRLKWVGIPLESVTLQWPKLIQCKFLNQWHNVHSVSMAKLASWSCPNIALYCDQEVDHSTMQKSVEYMYFHWEYSKSTQLVIVWSFHHNILVSLREM